jgi:hypothetical protein
VDGGDVTVEILDSITGESDNPAERIRVVTNCQAFIIVYSVASRNTFLELFEKLDYIRKLKESSRVVGILVGNKTDLKEDRKVSLEEGQAMAKIWNVPFIEMSCKSETNLAGEAFVQCYKELKKSSNSKDWWNLFSNQILVVGDVKGSGTVKAMEFLASKKLAADIFDGKEEKNTWSSLVSYTPKCTLFASNPSPSSSNVSHVIWGTNRPEVEMPWRITPDITIIVFSLVYR